MNVPKYGGARVRISTLWILGFALAVLGSWVNVAHAQTLKFTAQATTGNGSVTPVLTWCTETAASTGATCTNPGPATSCTASGSWTGAKAASGTQTLAAITQTATYNLSCTWPNNSLTVTWTPATKNTDGLNYTDPKAVRVYWGTQANPQANTRDVLVPATSTALTGLAPSTYVISAASVNLLNIESVPTTPITVTINNATANKSIGVTVNPAPMPPTNVTAQ
jgi:hypothetical protein